MPPLPRTSRTSYISINKSPVFHWTGTSSMENTRGASSSEGSMGGVTRSGVTYMGYLHCVQRHMRPMCLLRTRIRWPHLHTTLYFERLVVFESSSGVQTLSIFKHPGGRTMWPARQGQFWDTDFPGCPTTCHDSGTTNGTVAAWKSQIFPMTSSSTSTRLIQ